MAAPNAAHVLARIEKDPTFRSFSMPDFDPTAFASKVVLADAASSPDQERRSRAEITMAEITTNVGQIDAAIQGHITTHRDKLLGNVSGIRELQGDCAALSVAVQEVKRSVQRISRELREPFEGIRARTEQLSRVHAGSLLLKRVLRVQMTVRKLRALEPTLGLVVLGQVEAGTASAADLEVVDLRELAKAAQNLYEIEELMEDARMRGIDVVDQERTFVRTIGQAVRALAGAKLREGMAALNQADVGGALQVFYNLHLLPERTQSAVESVVSRVADRVASTFEPRVLEALGRKVEVAAEMKT